MFIFVVDMATNEAKRVELEAVPRNGESVLVGNSVYMVRHILWREGEDPVIYATTGMFSTSWESCMGTLPK